MIKLIVGLGNPGREYEFTRHNIGWLVIDELLTSYSINWKSKFKGEYCEADIHGQKIYFLKPQTYMNLSGESVVPLMQFFKIQIDEIMVLHDELDLNFGKIAFKQGGGLAGHNGLKSIAQHLSSQEFKRMRIGIGRPDKGSVSDWVLSSFYDQSDENVGKVLTKSADALKVLIKDGYQKAANQFSNKNILE
jgi:peptidyl-tRNA hydrolase, PTH1 family